MDLLFERAEQLVQLQRYQEAEKELRLLLTQDPENTDALALFAICQAEQGRIDDALKTIQNAISLRPDNDFYLYLQGLFLFRGDKFKEAERAVSNAISFNPRNPDYFGLMAAIKINQKEFAQGLESANEGLAIDPDNLQCLNMRSTALFKLNKKDEAYATIQEALNQDPENELTHANLGWGLLERGDHKKALTHFREALKINPNYSYAKAGLIEGLKSRYLFYRLFLKYVFFISNLKGKFQWAMVIGMYVGIQLIDSLADRDAALAVWLRPIVYIYIAFALSTWIIVPLSNLFLRLNVYGRFALSKDEIRASTYVGIGFFTGIAALLYYLFVQQDLFLITGMVGISMMIPFSSMFRAKKPRSRKILIACSILLLVVGLLNILVTGLTDQISILFQIYIFGIVAYGWVANAMIIRMD